jgi:hypothetical protein
LAPGEILLEREDMKKRGLASPDLVDALGLTFALPAAAMAWGLSPAQAFMQTEYDLYAEFDDDYWNEE